MKHEVPHPRNAYFFTLLKDKGLKPSDVARRAHVSRQYMGSVRLGIKPVSLEVLYSVVSPFDENFEKILDECQSSRLKRSSNSWRKAS